MKTIEIIIQVVSGIIFLCTILVGCKENPIILQRFENQDNIEVKVSYIDQGAFGSYVEISLRKENHPSEVLFLRSEDAKPVVDSVKNNIVYIHYDRFPSIDSILNPEKVLLGESLFNDSCGRVFIVDYQQYKKIKVQKSVYGKMWYKSCFRGKKERNERYR